MIKNVAVRCVLKAKNAFAARVPPNPAGGLGLWELTPLSQSL